MRSAALPGPEFTGPAGTAPQMTDRDFTRIATRIEAMAGIVLEEHKRQMIVSRLSRRLQARNLPSFCDYLDLLDSGRDPEELQEFVNTLTTNLTAFFREAHHFQHFDTEVLGPIVRGADARLRVWSAGCSSGEEPYSIALSVMAVLKRLPEDVRILATDLDTGMLLRARRGIYPAERCAGLDARVRRLIGEPDGDGNVHMPAEVRATITFRQLNLLEKWPMRGPFNAIFCRNVMIYFSQATKEQLIDRFAAMLTEGGFLYLGHSESILGRHPLLTACGETVYRRNPAA